MKKNERGFTLIELIMVIVILGFLAATAIPQFFDLSGNAKTANEQGVVAAVRSGLMTFYVNSAKTGGTPGYPATLDSVAASTTCADATPCFVTVLQQNGVTDGKWAKAAAALTYTSPTARSFVYTPATGDFK